MTTREVRISWPVKVQSMRHQERMHRTLTTMIRINESISNEGINERTQRFAQRGCTSCAERWHCSLRMLWLLLLSPLHPQSLVDPRSARSRLLSCGFSLHFFAKYLLTIYDVELTTTRGDSWFRFFVSISKASSEVARPHLPGFALNCLTNRFPFLPAALPYLTILDVLHIKKSQDVPSSLIPSPSVQFE